jgi:hypothetical protein
MFVELAIDIQVNSQYDPCTNVKVGGFYERSILDRKPSF